MIIKDSVGIWSKAKHETLDEVLFVWFVPKEKVVYQCQGPVSYTHLDVYKRQSLLCYYVRT